MKKLKNEIQGMNITKLILLFMALIITMVALISSASAAVPNDGTPNYGTATVDGDISEWNLDVTGPDYFAPMYEGWDENGKDRVLSKLYLRYHCNGDGTVTIYALVLKEPNVTVNDTAGNAWIAIDGIQYKKVSDDGTGTFAWVYASDETTKIGYEGSFILASGSSYGLIAHIQVTDSEGEDQTSGTYLKEIPLIIPICQPVEKLTVSKTAVTSYNRTHNWDITKNVTTEKEYTHEGFPKIWLYTDGSGDENAIWTVNVTYNGYEDSDFNVSGVITIKNDGDLPANITSINDVIVETTSETPVTVSWGVSFPYNLPVGSTLTGTYNEPVDGKIEGSNNVTVTTERGSYEAGTDIVWGDPTIEKYKTITVKDISDLFGTQDLGTVTAPDNKQFTYPEDPKEFKWADYGENGCGDYTYVNTATIVETDQSATATLKVNVQCYMYETAYAKKDNGAICFLSNPYFNFANWGWTNPIMPGTYTMNLWAGAAQCDTTKGTLVGTVEVVYDSATPHTLTVNYNNMYDSYILKETHVYAGYNPFPTDKKGKLTVAPGQYTNAGQFDGNQIYVISHAVVGIPDPNFGPN
ncbi:hypothetical protein FXW07_15385 [Methanosarcina sp. DH1]|uniref:hypothetical protein n=1 Tax=Methanosarcina sp. DH1 TaxID=2605695 RepID=UPI001E35672B|nr:hypothetical protein [Methanosarcina sp. DH1]MCC4767938.1 hypothetical protein [Methanosarcina sp. DH1]